MIACYTLPEMRERWSDESKFRHWMDVEPTICRVMAELGLIPEKSLKNILESAERVTIADSTTAVDYALKIFGDILDRLVINEKICSRIFTVTGG